MSVQQRSRVDEEDDLDDLDDVLDQFSPPPQPVANADETLTTEFTDKLAEGMESLFRQLGSGAGARSEDAERDLLAAWEAMLVEGMDGSSNPSTSTSNAHASESRPREDIFQSRIRSTINRLRESESGLSSSGSSTSGGADNLQSLLSQLEGLGDLGGEGEEQIQGVLEAMVGQLMSKDVLYEPLKELYEKMPEYLANNASTISPADKMRFEAQRVCIKQLIDEFEARTYRDDDERARERVVELMGELQLHGSPPEDIIGPLPPGFSVGADGLADVPDGCNLN